METWVAQQAAWIWLPGEERPVNAYVQFRKRFMLSAPSAGSRVYVSADCRYLLYLNGHVVGRGPVTTDPRYKQIDPYQVTGLLVPGENVLAALVLQRHARTSRLCPCRGGFLLELRTDGGGLGTDETWKARWAAEYRMDVPMMTHQYGQQEWVDGRAVPVGWQAAGFDDQAWSPAVRVPDADRCWPIELELRAVPHMRRQIVHPKALVAYFGLTTSGRPPENDPEPARQILAGYPMSSVVAWNPENLLHPHTGPAVFMEKQGDGVGIVIDLGEEMYGHPFLDIECPAGTVVDIGHGEVLSRNRVQTVLFPDCPAEQRYADRYITRAGRQRFEVFDTKGCRYLEIHFNRLARFYTGAKVIIHEVGFVRLTPPFDLVSQLDCPDERLNRVWDICRRTALVKCQDWHICDAQREQNNWPEIFQDMLYLQCFGRVEMVRQMIHQFCRAQLPGGFFLSTFPTIDKSPEQITENDLYVFSTVVFPLIVYLDWLYGGEDERQVFWLECCKRSFDALARYLGSKNTLANLPGCQWVEWSGLDARDPGRGVTRSWEMTVWNALHVLALEKTAELADALDHGSWAAQWRRRAEAIRQAANARFWSDARRAYLDGIYDGAPSSLVSQSTNAAAVLARLGDDARLRQAMAVAENPGVCDVPSAINMQALYHEALESLDLDAPVLDRIRQKWGYMLDHGATTTWEALEALERNQGLCFGFAGHPLNYLTRTLLGVVPLTPRYRQFSVRIAAHGLREARGRVIVPSGEIRVAWTHRSEALALDLTVPAGCQAVVALPRGVGSVRSVLVDGIPAALSQRLVAAGTFVRQMQPTCLVAAGDHAIAFIPCSTGDRT